MLYFIQKLHLCKTRLQDCRQLALENEIKVYIYTVYSFLWFSTCTIIYLKYIIYIYTLGFNG